MLVLAVAKHGKAIKKKLFSQDIMKLYNKKSEMKQVSLMSKEENKEKDVLG